MPVLQSSSNFGKLRSTRFHSGVDFRTGGVEGKRVLAVEDGQIYRIGVKPYGYGNVVYVAHPDGNISVYGHLSKFTPEVEAYVRSERYRQQRNDIDLFPEAGRFPVNRPVGQFGQFVRPASPLRDTRRGFAADGEPHRKGILPGER